VRARAVNSEERKAGMRDKESTYNPILTEPIGKEIEKRLVLSGSLCTAGINVETKKKDR
jgi:hypothetical protein